MLRYNQNNRTYVNANNVQTSEAQRRWTNLVKNTLPLWETIGCTPTPSVAAIKSAYRRKALEVHPDKPGGSNALFRDVKLKSDKLVTAVNDLLLRFTELSVSASSEH